MQQVGCITIFLCSMVATCQFSTQLGLAKPSLEGKSKMLFFSERQNHFEEKKHSLFVYLLGASYMQKESEIKFLSLAEEI